MTDDLYILWTNDNPVTADKMVFMYASNSIKHGWWSEVTIIIWGATGKLAAEDDYIAGRIKEMLESGVKVSACKACADELEVSERLLALGVDVRYWGEGLTMILKSDTKLLTV